MDKKIKKTKHQQYLDELEWRKEEEKPYSKYGNE